MFSVQPSYLGKPWTRRVNSIFFLQLGEIFGTKLFLEFRTKLFKKGTKHFFCIISRAKREKNVRNPTAFFNLLLYLFEHFSSYICSFRAFFTQFFLHFRVDFSVLLIRIFDIHEHVQNYNKLYYSYSPRSFFLGEKIGKIIRLNRLEQKEHLYEILNN